MFPGILKNVLSVMCFIYSISRVGIVFILYMNRFARVKKYRLLRSQSQTVGQVHLTVEHLFSFFQPFPASCIFIMSFILTKLEPMTACKLVIFVCFFRWFKGLYTTHVHTSFPIQPRQIMGIYEVHRASNYQLLSRIRCTPANRPYHLSNFYILSKAGRVI